MFDRLEFRFHVFHTEENKNINASDGDEATPSENTPAIEQQVPQDEELKCPYKELCPQKNYAFANQANLEKHIEYQHKVKCDNCQATFPTKSDLNGHRIKKHQQHLCQDILCNRRRPFATKKRLKKHMDDQHQKKCGTCSAGFPTDEKLADHYKKTQHSQSCRHIGNNIHIDENHICKNCGVDVLAMGEVTVTYVKITSSGEKEDMSITYIIKRT